MAFDEWLEIDEEPGEQEGPGVVVDAKGITVWSEGARTHAPWLSILTHTRVEDTLYVLVPRKPPAPPWLEIDEARAAAAGTNLDALVASIEARGSAAISYREVRATRPRVSPEQLLARLVEGDPVPGTVEVPVAIRPSNDAARAAALGGAGGLYTGLLALSPYGAVGVLAALGAGVLGGGTLYFLTRRIERLTGKRKVPRVLALAPDGCVFGLAGGVRARAWSDLGPLAIELRGGKFHLVYRTPEGEELGALRAAWFSKPLELIVALAEAYRTHAATSRQRHE